MEIQFAFNELLPALLFQPQAGILAFLAGLLLIVIANLSSLKRIEDFRDSEIQPFISILVPARNEALNIEDCVTSLLNQQYENYEVIVLDDESQDETGAILARLNESNSRLQVLTGKPLPSGWVGKPWACQQLANAASGDLLLFTDADTRHRSLTLRSAAAAKMATGVQFISGMPRQIMSTWAERITIPMLAFVIFALLPLPLARRLPIASLSAAVGQFLLFTRSAYDQIGGHEAVKNTSVEDLVFARLIKSQGIPWLFVNLSNRVECRMYRNASQTMAGISKNLFAVFNYNLLTFSLAWIWLLFVFTQPLVGIGASLTGYPLPGFSVPLGLAAVGLSLLLWLVNNWRFGMPVAYAIFYPITPIMYVAMAARSAWAYYTGRSMSWKGRQLSASERKTKP